MPRTGKNIYKRKDGRWEGRYIKERVNGKARYGTIYARNYQEVKKKLEEVKSQREKRELFSARAGTVDDFGKQWLLEVAESLKESSAIKYENLLRCYILPEFGEDDLSRITNERFIGFVGRLLKSGGTNGQGLAPSTVSEVVSVMKGIRIYAMKRGCLTAFSPECVTVRQNPKKIRVFSLEEEKRLIDYLRNHMDLTCLGILLCLFTGIRVGEICALKWDDISLSEQTMQIGKTMQRLRVEEEVGARTKVKISAPKSVCSARIIPLPDALMELLSEYYVAGAFFLTGDRDRYIEPRTMQNRLRRILEASGIQKANFHTTRHTFATRCIEMGFDVKTLSEILGHASVSITMNRYVHPSMALKAEHMNRLSELFVVK
ncbi:MAG: site-specific integrase [Lachnospiraceae bacterium]|nr:site-specific integrase [Lachnospiraceae bacterium]